MSKSETGSQIEPVTRHSNHAVSNLRVFLITTFVSFGGFLFGYDCVIGGQLVEMAKFRQDFGSPQPPNGEYGFSHALRGSIVSILSAGTFLGALSSSLICDNFGRKRGLIITCGIFSIGVVFQTVAVNIPVLMVGRFIAGYGVGLISVMIPLYQSECVPAERRGTVVSCYQFAITIGLLIGQIVANFTESYASEKSYRVPIGLQFLWSGVLAIGMLFSPESPRYLIRAGKWEKAVRSKVRLSGLPADHPLVQEELLEIQGNYEHELRLGKPSWRECWKGNNRRRTLLGIFMQIWQQCNSAFFSFILIQVTGVNFVFYYGPMFFKTAGVNDPFKVSMIMGTVNCLCTLPGLYLVDKIGRRRLLLCGAMAQLLSQFLVGIIDVATHGTKPIWTAIFSGTFIAAFAVSWGPCAWVISSELFGLKTRAKQMAFTVAGNW